MGKCRGCGKDHELILEDQNTGTFIEMDWCRECCFTQRKRVIEYELSKIQMELLRELIEEG